MVLAGDVVELLGSPGSTATDILRPHEDLCAALLEVTARGGQVIYTIGNHDGDLAWDVKAADAVREMTGARLCLAADLILADGRKIRVEHGHQLDPYNCFCDARNPLDTPMGHHIVREVIPRIEFLGRGWVDGAHEMADPTDFPSFIGSRLVYRKLARHLWWLIALPLAILILVRIPEFTAFRSRYPDTDVWVHRAEILGYGAVADLVVIAALVGILARRAWVSISALALDKRGYGQNTAARQRAADLVADGYYGFVSGHTHHPELAATGVRLLRQLRLVHLGGGGHRREVRPAPGLRAQPAGLLGGDQPGRHGAGLRPGRAARRDPDGAVRGPRPQPALRLPGARGYLAARPRLAARRPESRPQRAPAAARLTVLSRARRPWPLRW